MPDPQVYVVSVHDEEPERPVLAVDLKHILAALRPVAGDWHFCVVNLEATGAGAEPLHSQIEAASGRGAWFGFDEMQGRADAIEQTIEGVILAFAGSTTPETVNAQELELGSFPSSRAVCAIVAIDSSYFEVYAKNSAVVERIRQSFTRVISRDTQDYFS